MPPPRTTGRPWNTQAWPVHHLAQLAWRRKMHMFQQPRSTHSKRACAVAPPRYNEAGERLWNMMCGADFHS